ISCERQGHEPRHLEASGSRSPRRLVPGFHEHVESHAAGSVREAAPQRAGQRPAVGLGRRGRAVSGLRLDADGLRACRAPCDAWHAICCSRSTRKTGLAAMYNVTEFPIDRLSDRELRLREWECVMAGGYGSSEHKRLQSEMWRRTSNHYVPA